MKSDGRQSANWSDALGTFGSERWIQLTQIGSRSLVGDIWHDDDDDDADEFL